MSTRTGYICDNCGKVSINTVGWSSHTLTATFSRVSPWKTTKYLNYCSIECEATAQPFLKDYQIVEKDAIEKVHQLYNSPKKRKWFG